MLVGPACYVPPATGRCGSLGGPDFPIGWVQRFTQECLNHDQCCNFTMISPPIFGRDCEDTFITAIPGFFLAPDCGTTAGDWNGGDTGTCVLTGGDSRGDPQTFTGTVNTGNVFCPIWNVLGTRTGRDITMTITNPSGGGGVCAASANLSGIYNNCNTASGTWTNSLGQKGEWSWKRVDPVGNMPLVSKPNALPWYARK